MSKWKVLKILEQHNRAKFYSVCNYEQIEVRKCLLIFGAESFVFQFAIHKFED